MQYQGLASYHRCCNRIAGGWRPFRDRHRQHLEQGLRFGNTPEKAAEVIVADLLTSVLDWASADLNYQLRRADIVVSRVGLKALLIETKRPRSLAWNERAVRQALSQAWTYARDQRVPIVAISDGLILYAEEWVNGGPQGRVFVDLTAGDPPLDLWWLSVDGVYRPRPEGASAVQLPHEPAENATAAAGVSELLHPKYRLPCRCFAYVGDPTDPHTWHLPFLEIDGRIDARRLPKAVQAIVSNYRGAHISSVPERSIPAVLVRLAQACAKAGHLPPVQVPASNAYARLWLLMDQFDELVEVKRQLGDSPNVTSTPQTASP